MAREDQLLKRVDTEEKVIALTFDDGPNPEFTPQLLDVFKKHKAKATFYVMGDHVDQHPDIVRRAAAEGHEIGNHTQTHPDMSLIGEYEMRDELRLAEESIHRAIGEKCATFRIPYGRRNETVLQVVEEAGYLNVLWTTGLDTLDWDNRTAEQIYNVVRDNADKGTIVLMHDSSHAGVGSRAETVKAVDMMLEDLGKQGFRFVTVSELAFK